MGEELKRTSIENPDDYLSINCTTENLALVNNAEGCTDLGSMAIVGSTAYCIKTNSANSLSVFYTVKDYKTYTTSSSKIIANYTTKTISGLHHANGMAYYNKKLYVVGYTSEIFQAFRLSLKGDVEIIYQMPCKASAISFYKKDSSSGDETFIVRADDRLVTDSAGNKYYYFIVGVFKETSSGRGVFEEKSHFFALCGPYTVNQDITYIRNHLIVPTVKKELDAEGNYVYLKNKILIYYIGESEPWTNEGFSYYSCNTVLNIDKSKDTTYKKYELESPQLVDDKIICVANIERTVTPKSADGFQKITGYTLIN